MNKAERQLAARQAAAIEVQLSKPNLFVAYCLHFLGGGITGFHRLYVGNELWWVFPFLTVVEWTMFLAGPTLFGFPVEGLSVLAVLLSVAHFGLIVFDFFALPSMRNAEIRRRLNQVQRQNQALLEDSD